MRALQRLPPVAAWHQAAPGEAAALRSPGVCPQTSQALRQLKASVAPRRQAWTLTLCCLQGSAPPIGGGFQLPASSYALPRISTAAPQPALLSKALFEELSGTRQHGAEVNKETTRKISLFAGQPWRPCPPTLSLDCENSSWVHTDTATSLTPVQASAQLEHCRQERLPGRLHHAGWVAIAVYEPLRLLNEAVHLPMPAVLKLCQCKPWAGACWAAVQSSAAAVADAS